jgi:PPOX class probable F420-dependent enzyme
MSMDAAAARALFASARVARLATIGPEGRPRLVPITFALDGDTIYTAVDQKPKVTTRLQRLRNVAADPRVSVLADHYDDEDWSALWWVRADGFATVVDEVTGEEPLLLELRDKYRFNYGMQSMTGPAIVVDVERWSGWDASDST